MGKIVIKADHIGMQFRMSTEKVDNLKEFIIKTITKRMKYKGFWALKNVSFSVEQGDRIGFLGANGAGKSTLLKIIAGVLKPTEGKVIAKGKIVPLLELGAGFDLQYTGAENIYLYGAVLGYPKEFINEKFNEIVEFSELGEFIDVPVKNYSSGMKARLGFSIATVVEPDILILDEVLSVGDAKFRKKSENRIKEMFDKGVTVLFVSHNINQIKEICNKAILLEQGTIVAQGEVNEVALIYKQRSSGIYPRKKKKKKRRPVEIIDDKFVLNSDSTDEKTKIILAETKSGIDTVDTSSKGE